MPLHPEFEALFAQFAIAAEGQPPDPPIALRREGANAMLPPAPEITVSAVEDRSIPVAEGEIGVRIYHPSGAGPHPLVVYFHGGGWATANVDTHDAQTRDLCNGAHCVVVSVDYRLAPEHLFPTAAEDCYAATCWAIENAKDLNADPDRVAVVGDSAGGNLAAVMTLMARDRGGPTLHYQVLIYPVTDTDFDNASYTANAEGYLLTRELMLWFWEQYCPDHEQRKNPYAAPMRAEDLSGLPPALVLTGEYDPLRDEGEAYAQRLEAAGVAVESVCYDGLPHYFIALSRFAPVGRVGMDKVCETLRDVFAVSAAPE
jgi:acetyl esterase